MTDDELRPPLPLQRVASDAGATIGDEDDALPVADDVAVTVAGTDGGNGDVDPTDDVALVGRVRPDYGVEKPLPPPHEH